MSRSYKHFPAYKQTIYKMKRLINKKLRAQLKRTYECLNYSLYKKMNCSWDICDHSSTYFWHEYLRDYKSDLIHKSYLSPMSLIYYHRWYTWK